MNLNIEQRFLDIGEVKFFINLNANFQSRMYFQEDENIETSQKPYALLDASLRMETKNGLNLSFYIQNVFNEKYAIFRYVYKGPQYTLGNPRNIGLNVGYRY